MKYCALFFNGLMQSYGCSNSFMHRHNTNEFPTRSAISGMICKGLGRFGEQIDFLKAIKDKVKINIYGFNCCNTFLDYQIVGSSSHNYYERFTIKNNKNLFKANDMNPMSYDAWFVGGNTRKNNSVVHKQYLTNNKFGVVLFSEDDDLLDEIINAFIKPKYVLCYGRKNCIVSGNVFCGKFDSLEQCLNCYKDKNLEIKYEITEYDNNSDCEIYLNDVPVRFGDDKIYQQRIVYKKDY